MVYSSRFRLPVGYLVASLSGLTAWNDPLGCASQSSSIQKYKRTSSNSPTRAARAADCRQKKRIFDSVLSARPSVWRGDDAKQPPAGTLGTTSTSRRSVRQQGHLLQRRAICQLTTVIYRLVEASVLVPFDLSQSIFSTFSNRLCPFWQRPQSIFVSTFSNLLSPF